MVEPRSVCYGRFLAKKVNQIINLLPETKRATYASKLIDELNKPFDFGALKDIFCFDIVKNPEHYAKLIKTGIYFGRPRKISKIIMNSLLRNLSNL